MQRIWVKFNRVRILGCEHEQVHQGGVRGASQGQREGQEEYCVCVCVFGVWERGRGKM